MFFALGMHRYDDNHIYVYDSFISRGLYMVACVNHDGSIFLYEDTASFEEVVNWILNTQQSSTLKGYPEHDMSYRGYLINEFHQAILAVELKNKQN
jgi:hypothetical protein